MVASIRAWSGVGVRFGVGVGVRVGVRVWVRLRRMVRVRLRLGLGSGSELVRVRVRIGARHAVVVPQPAEGERVLVPCDVHVHHPEHVERGETQRRERRVSDEPERLGAQRACVVWCGLVWCRLVWCVNP